jgi:signal peptidase
MASRRRTTTPTYNSHRGSALQALLDVLPWLLLSLLVLPVVVGLAPGLVGGDYSFVVQSGSMSPAIATGDLVVVQTVDPADIGPGDVVTYVTTTHSDPVTHRVVGVEASPTGERLFVTQGDANDIPDDPVPASNVLGRVTLVLPYLGHLLLFGATPVGFVTLVLAVPLTHFVLSTALKSVRR